MQMKHFRNIFFLFITALSIQSCTTRYSVLKIEKYSSPVLVGPVEKIGGGQFVKENKKPNKMEITVFGTDIINDPLGEFGNILTNFKLNGRGIIKIKKIKSVSATFARVIAFQTHLEEFNSKN